MAVVIAATACAVVVPAGDARAATTINLSATGPLGPVTVIGDSVLLGAGLYSPTLPDQLAARGWGPIRFRAAGSATSGAFPVADEFRSSYWIDLWQQQGWDPTHVIVNLGVNDSGFCRTNFSCAYDSIMHVVEAIGPGHEIWWPTITKSTASSRNVFNAALAHVDAQRSDFHVWDWYSEFQTGRYRSGDQIHLDPDGYRRRSALMASEFTELFSAARRTGGDEPLPTPTTPASTLVTTTPRRIADTRDDSDSRVRAGTSLVIDFGEALADGATAVALYVAAARPGARGYLSAGPCGAEPTGATLNFEAGVPIGAPSVVALGDGDDVCIFASADTDVVVDLQGTFVAGNGGLRMSPLATPDRLLDTRGADRNDRLVLRAPAGAEAVALNLAAVRAETIGFLRAAGCDDETGVANVNFAPGAPVSASAFVPVDDDGTFCVTASTDVDVIVDLTATFGASGALAYVPVAPTRTLDTRRGTGGWEPLHGAGQTIDVGVAPPDAAAVTGTLTLVRPDTVGYAIGDGCVGSPPTASVNANAGIIAANSLTTGVLEGKLCVFSSARTQTVFDTNGWWTE